jgi:hypothetical protein
MCDTIYSRQPALWRSKQQWNREIAWLLRISGILKSKTGASPNEPVFIYWFSLPSLSIKVKTVDRQADVEVFLATPLQWIYYRNTDRITCDLLTLLFQRKSL